MTRTQKRVAQVAGAVLLVVALVVGIVALVAWDDRQNEQRRADEVRLIERANTMCLPQQPIAIKQHGPGWSRGPYWEVRCPDNSVRVLAEP